MCWFARALVAVALALSIPSLEAVAVPDATDLGLPLTPGGPPNPPTQPATPPGSREVAKQVLPETPVLLIENRGQWDSVVLFQARSQDVTYWFTHDEVICQVVNPTLGSAAGAPAPDLAALGLPREMRVSAPGFAEQEVVRLRIENANIQAPVLGVDEAQTRFNYLKGRHPEDWHTDVRSFRRIVYHNVYPGIDLAFYGRDGLIEYDFIVRPGADPEMISLRLDGMHSAGLGIDGELVIATAWGDFTHHPPRIHIEDQGHQVAGRVEGGFCLREDGTIGFGIGDSDPAGLTLVIDPQLEYSTLLGGNNFDHCSGIAVDPAGNVYVTGRTTSTDFPLVNNIPMTSALNGDGFVSKLAPDASTLIYSTVIGGELIDYLFEIEVDASGAAYVVGSTESTTDFPLVNEYSATHGGFVDAVVCKLSPAGNTLLYSTYIGAFGSDWGYALDVDSDGLVYIAGETLSFFFPTVNPFIGTFNLGDYTAGETDIFVSVFDPTLSGSASLLSSSYLGGSSDDLCLNVKVDDGGGSFQALHLTGWTESTDFQTVNAYQAAAAGGQDGIVVTLVGSPTSLSIASSTLLGGSADDWTNGIALDPGDGSLVVSGYTASTDFPMAFAGTPYDATLDGPTDGFVAKIDHPNLVFSTYLGGSDDDYANELVVDPIDGDPIYVGGQTASADFPVSCASDDALGGADDGFLVGLSGDGSNLVYGTYIGGAGSDFVLPMESGTGCEVYVAGGSYSSNFPTTPGTYDRVYSGDRDAFIQKYSPCDNTILVTSAADDGSIGTLRWAIDVANNCPGPNTIEFINPFSNVIHVNGGLGPLPALADPSGGTFINGLSGRTQSGQFLPGCGVYDIPGVTSGALLRISSSGNRIEGLILQGGPGVDAIVVDNSATFDGNTLRHNWILAPANDLAIDLGDDGITTNDGGDADTGPNTLLNCPVIDAIAQVPGGWTFQGTAPPNSTVDIHASCPTAMLGSAPWDSPSGKGTIFNWIVSTTANGTGDFEVTTPSLNGFATYTALATDASGNTSEPAVAREATPNTTITGYSPISLIVISPDGLDSIGPGFNTFGVRASYDSLTDYGIGANGTLGEADDRISLVNCPSGSYTVKIRPDVGATGGYFLGIRVNGSSEVWTGPAVSGALSATAIYNPLPAPGTEASVSASIVPPLAGDFDFTRLIDAVDLAMVIDAAFFGAPLPSPESIADINCDGSLADAVDLAVLIDYVFFGGTIPVCEPEL